MKRHPTIIAKDLLVIHAVIDRIVFVAYGTELNAIMDFQWFDFDFGNYLVNQSHTLSVVNNILMAVYAVIFIRVILQIN